MTYLGLDFQNPYYVGIGDYRYYNSGNYVNSYSIEKHEVATAVEPINNYTTVYFTTAQNNIVYVNNTIKIPKLINYSKVY